MRDGFGTHQKLLSTNFAINWGTANLNAETLAKVTKANDAVVQRIFRARAQRVEVVPFALGDLRQEVTNRYLITSTAVKDVPVRRKAKHGKTVTVIERLFSTIGAPQGFWTICAPGGG